MDREISIEERRKESRKKRLYVGGVFLAVVASVAGLMMLLGESVKENDLLIKKAELASLESSVSASGKIVPLYEQAIVSPVATRIIEVYCNEGDTVEADQSLLKLDLQSAETDLRRISDEVSMKKNEIEQASLANATYLTDLEMKIKVKEMSVSHLKAEVANEKRLDSIGSGTGDRIREAELAYSTARLELEQLKMQLNNERKSHAASFRSKQLEGSISARNLEEMRRTLDDARVKAPRKGTVTWLNKDLGASIGAGQKLAVVSDLTHFKIEGEIPESNSGKLSVGSTVVVRINRNTVTGKIATISPQSINGMAQFTVFLDNDNDHLLRSGLRTDLNVVYDVRENVVRIPNGSYFQGAGNYFLFVKVADDKLERRNVLLGDSNFDYVEVKSGISPGEEVVISDMSSYKEKKSINLK
ncbi:efflux RND transporter periplasmic adaptor subunit [Lepagella muris]|jgi:HlyD family secretion protein|uniref:HlyD family efflux transporter periplasmic adaptor subunit n=1 Tax=Lepagella muris TaxID=3032870 RepID=A0AC61RED6_9BACT|nr:HlyD family efflux transporter periplasmic adaptor subunit [Lepagella muris]ROT07100.1 HlyD family efflux transporter periplasmic adaptor subunit [Muribaculaceae bacterium Isolate-037 (Harlan)]TGY77937.1 HlyD family efflux transporter periplasmic adaptor subunit [Lepagella muris]THG51393.1 HlyD family efflux transporter periplasmic adaptor subunit [Bacteroidales bacterium]TKC56364.1 HlyD family efflux transporter periplasmic adaptor subunit [Bacteroidales bacterium]